MKTGTALLTGFLVAVMVIGGLVLWWDPAPPPPADALIHSRLAPGLVRAHHRIPLPPAALRGYTPMPAALTGTPPQEVWLPRQLSVSEKTQRAAADKTLAEAERLRSEVMQNSSFLRGELTDGQYDAIESQLDTVKSMILQHPKYEYLESDAAGFADGTGGFMRPDKFFIDAWVKAHPKDAWAHYAEGLRWFNDAWAARGGGWAADVKDSAWPKFQRDIREARAEFGTALRLDPDLVVAWAGAIDADRSGSDFDAVKRDYAQSLKHHPVSLLTAEAYEFALNPHWYGSYEEMDAFAQKAAPHSDQNPFLWSLQGNVAAAKACAYCNHYDWLTGLKQYNRALAFEDEPDWLTGAGDAAVHLHRYGLAYKYYERASQYKPGVFSDVAHMQLLQALCDPKESELKFKALLDETQGIAGADVTVTAYPRKKGDCDYYTAELPWGDEPAPDPGDLQGYDISYEVMKSGVQAKKKQ